MHEMGKCIMIEFIIVAIGFVVIGYHLSKLYDKVDTLRFDLQIETERRELLQSVVGGLETKLKDME